MHYITPTCRVNNALREVFLVACIIFRNHKIGVAKLLKHTLLLVVFNVYCMSRKVAENAMIAGNDNLDRQVLYRHRYVAISLHCTRNVSWLERV